MEEGPSREFSLIRSLTLGLDQGEGVALGVGDDAAVVHPPPGEALVIAADLLVEGVHFDLRYTPPDALGHKVLAVNLSDLAAMGARPLWALLSMALPAQTPGSVLQPLFGGLRSLARRFGVALIGGDTTGAREGALTLGVTVIGATGGVLPITRRGAAPGDLIYVCGTLGGAAWALRRLMDGEPPGPWAHPLFYPEPRVGAGRWLAGSGALTSMIDVSDGLLPDLGHLLARGEVAGEAQLGAHLRLDDLPLDPALAQAAREGLDPWPLALSGGEDYALVFTVSAREEHRLSQEGAPVCHPIGVVTSERGITLEGVAGVDRGHPFDHFKEG